MDPNNSTELRRTKDRGSPADGGKPLQRKENPWLLHCKEVKSKNPELAYKDILKKAKDSYKSKPSLAGQTSSPPKEKPRRVARTPKQKTVIETSTEDTDVQSVEQPKKRGRKRKIESPQ